MRQAHGIAFGKSDMFFLVALKPEPGQEEVTFQASELEAARWMPIDEYASLQGLSAFSLRLMACCRAYLDGSYRGIWTRKVQAGHRNQEDLLMFGEQALGPDRNEDAWLGLASVGVTEVPGGSAAAPGGVAPGT